MCACDCVRGCARRSRSDCEAQARGSVRSRGRAPPWATSQCSFVSGCACGGGRGRATWQTPLQRAGQDALAPARGLGRWVFGRRGPRSSVKMRAQRGRPSGPAAVLLCPGTGLSRRKLGKHGTALLGDPGHGRPRAAKSTPEFFSSQADQRRFDAGCRALHLTSSDSLRGHHEFYCSPARPSARIVHALCSQA